METVSFKNKSDFSATELEYANIFIDEVTLTENEMRTKFGAETLMQLKTNIPLRKYIVNEKIRLQARKKLSNRVNIEEMIKGIPLGIVTLMEIAKNGKTESSRVQAAVQLIKPASAFMDALFKAQGTIQGGLNEGELGDSAFPSLRYDPKDLKVND